MKSKGIILAAACLLVLAISLMANGQSLIYLPVTVHAFPRILRVSMTDQGTQANGDSFEAAISLDGRYVGYWSWADNIVAGGINNRGNVFLYEVQTGQTVLISKASDGTPGQGVSTSPSVSADGRYVAFQSRAGNLVAGDTNGQWDVFAHDRLTGETTRMSVSSTGEESNDISETDSEAMISSNGRYVVFSSEATNLVDDDTNGERDVFVHDRQTRTTLRVSVSSDGVQGDLSSQEPAISGDGQLIVFASHAGNLVAGDVNGNGGDLFIHELISRQTSRLPITFDWWGADNVAISDDGRFITFDSNDANVVPGDSNGVTDVFLFDRQTGIVERVSLSNDGSQAEGESLQAAVSADGRFVVFRSEGANLVDGDSNNLPDVFVRDRVLGTTVRVSIGVDGSEANGDSSFVPNAAPVISGEGRFIPFSSEANNLVPNDTNDVDDIFINVAR